MLTTFSYSLAYEPRRIARVGEAGGLGAEGCLELRDWSGGELVGR